MGTLSEQMAAFVTGLHYEDLPPNVVERVCLHALNIIGVCLLSAKMEFADVLRIDIMTDGGLPESTLIGGGGQRLPAPLASLYNSSLAHGNEFDDTYAPGRWHGSAPTIPPTFAVAESLRVDGKTLVTSLAGALEMGCRLARAAPTLMQNGFQPTSIIGILAATIAVGKAMALDAEHLANAIGISGVFAGGLTEFFNDPNPWSKRIQVGYAAHGAVRAARAAAHGFKGTHTILDGRYGFFRTYAREGNFDLSRITEGLGSDWEVLSICSKRYPCPHSAQSYIDSAILLSKVEGISPSRISRVECIVHPLVVPIMFEPRSIRYQPSNAWSARWSMPFIMAVALMDGKLSIDSFDEARLHDPTTRALMGKVVYTEDPSLPYPDNYPGWVRVRTVDGRVVERKILSVAGSPENPMAPEEYQTKFLDNAGRVVGKQRALEILRVLRELPDLEDVSQVTNLYA